MKRARDLVNRGDVNRLRFHVQWISFAALVWGARAAIDLSSSLPSFACPFTAGRGGTCYLFALQHQLHMPWKDFLSGRGIGFAVGFATFLGLFVLLSKGWCGFVCPLGTLQDLATLLRAKLKIPYSSYSESALRRLSSVKWVLLAVVILVPLAMSNSLLGLPKLGPEWSTAWCQLCPGRTILSLFGGEGIQWAVNFSSRTTAALTGIGLAITGVAVVGAFVKKRFFCLFCPMSALQHCFSRLGLLRLRKRGEGCTRCGDCHRACDMGIHEIADDVASRFIVTENCMLCLDCVAACPEEKVLEATFLGLPIYQSTPGGFDARAERRCHRAR
jgi:ferredoxin-type protein NapH